MSKKKKKQHQKKSTLNCPHGVTWFLLRQPSAHLQLGSAEGRRKIAKCSLSSQGWGKGKGFGGGLPFLAKAYCCWLMYPAIQHSAGHPRGQITGAWGQGDVSHRSPSLKPTFGSWWICSAPLRQHWFAGGSLGKSQTCLHSASLRSSMSSLSQLRPRALPGMRKSDLPRYFWRESPSTPCKGACVIPGSWEK